MDIKPVQRNEQHFGRKPCSYWLAGRCNRNPCRFLHSVTPSSSSYYTPQYNKPKNAYRYTRNPHSHYSDEKTTTNPKYNSKAVTVRETNKTGDEKSVTKKPSQTLCRYWVNDNCVKGDNCQNLHSWFTGDGFSTLAKLKEHKKVVTGITIPVGSDKLYSGSTDGIVRTWDCHTGQCTNVRNCGSEVNSLISEGPWIFVGLNNVVKAWNIQTSMEFTLDGPRGKVLAMVVGNDILFAAAQDGIISAWRGSSDANSPFELAASLSGHTKAIVCLTVGGKMLFSGSMDHSIKVWDLDTLQCKMTLNGHTDMVTSLICWDSFLLSSSSDCTIKIWVATEEGTIKVAYTHTEENGILALNGMSDAEGKPILFSSSADNSVRLYELPSFLERGRLFAKQVVRSIEIGPEGLFFTGDGTGLLMVWRWLEVPKVASS
ncbi:hypothetical protein TanjilG_21047 [Lupinus angustifolius]|uniref:C3H1-type domain-containing protein n=2 Tax=Lupinus angustifolius TaxID=3871 RepID=A0A1J7HT35_LUPAN|nr:PREDICTED: zinc finger CCCH domain-containing protein 48-like isoform X1 [Lupinus angustifolius]XP_019430300.1 PREDICTED: zinc finger CCCH domain-containing protein 48-like isoform X1 [Lupinus angustifolius]XP_019431572.1 PREDICTED: zinc finger CCCH domain-containing protein 48-like isoform X1 [Lupinus angustifolius]XP_019454794.1 PREDICTED: zinc finger CCCH domain-containing protein 48-like isoform X1 [Lupinus angustifolius]OIV93955.1 hypothetical protein TanjilG_05658 [Lupinus angustifoliu